MIDVLLIVVLICYAVSGYRQGMALSVLSLGGFLGGALFALWLVPQIVDRVPAGVERSVVALLGVLLLAWVGQLIGAMIGSRLRRSLTFRPLQFLDHAGGAVAGLIAVGLVLWFVGGALRNSPTPLIARSVASSRVLQAVDGAMPSQLSSLAKSLRDSVGDSAFPRVFSGFGPERITAVASPNPKAMSSATLAFAARSIVKISGDSDVCNETRKGSGAVVAPHRVVTNAHVVSGVRAPFVQVGGVGAQYAATVVLFDPIHDVAILSVPDLPAPALRFGSDLPPNADAIVAGFPNGGSFTSVPARVREVIQAPGDDIYGRPGAVRQVYSLFSKVEPGNSGGPLLGANGAMVGLVFARSPLDASTGYALTMAEVRSDVNAGITAGTQVSTRGCSTG